MTSPKLLDQMRSAVRRKQYSFRTEQSYTNWARRYILFHKKGHPKEMGIPEIEAFFYRQIIVCDGKGF